MKAQERLVLCMSETGMCIAVLLLRRACTATTSNASFARHIQAFSLLGVRFSRFEFKCHTRSQRVSLLSSCFFHCLVVFGLLNATQFSFCSTLEVFFPFVQKNRGLLFPFVFVLYQSLHRDQCGGDEQKHRREEEEQGSLLR
jgi:hypothetical protein